MQKRHPLSKEGPPVTTKFQSLSKIPFFWFHHHAVLKCTASSALHIWGKKTSVFTLLKGSFVSNGTMLASYTILTVAFCCSECYVLQDVELPSQHLCCYFYPIFDWSYYNRKRQHVLLGTALTTYHSERAQTGQWFWGIPTLMPAAICHFLIMVNGSTTRHVFE